MLATNLLSTLLIIAAAQAGAPKTYTNPGIGITLQLPGENWVMTDHSQGLAQVLVFSPDARLTTRCSILNLPVGLLPEGLLTRETGIKSVMGDAYERVGYAPVALAGETFDKLEYKAGGATTIEYGLTRGKFFLIVQLAAPDDDWAAADKRASLEAIATSVRLTTPTQVAVREAAAPTPGEIRKRRAARLVTDERAFEIARHELVVEIDPAKGTLEASDRITIRSRTDGLKAIALYYSGVTVDAVEPAADATWRARTGQSAVGGWDGRLDVTLKGGLAAGRETILTVKTSSHDFFETIDQKLVQEIDVVGQVREKSSFSSHVAYYPMDRINDAAMDITLVVPSAYTGVTGGRLVSTVKKGERTAYRYRTAVRVPRLLPFGFAVGRYESVTARSPGGLELTIYGYAGETDLLKQRADVARECAEIFERMMGPLPWPSVRFAHVTPQRKETGVSLPGLILISDGFFEDFSDVDLSDGALDRPDSLSLLIIADELSHQWNFYAVPLPNELAEGVSTFTNMLLIEHRHGTAAYRRSIDYCKDAYFKTLQLGRDVAIADPAVYSGATYRGIVFCKTPVVLDMLRTRLGDDVFFKAWRSAFTQFDRKRDGFDILQQAFSSASGRNQTSFFDQWFFRAGFPKIALSHEQAAGRLKITVRQTQSGAPYDLKSDLLIRGAGGKSIRHPIELHGREATVSIPCDFEVIEVRFDPEALILKQMEED